MITWDRNSILNFEATSSNCQQLVKKAQVWERINQKEGIHFTWALCESRTIPAKCNYILGKYLIEGTSFELRGYVKEKNGPSTQIGLRMQRRVMVESRTLPSALFSHFPFLKDIFEYELNPRNFFICYFNLKKPVIDKITIKDERNAYFHDIASQFLLNARMHFNLSKWIDGAKMVQSAFPLVEKCSIPGHLPYLLESLADKIIKDCPNSICDRDKMIGIVDGILKRALAFDSRSTALLGKRIAVNKELFQKKKVAALYKKFFATFNGKIPLNVYRDGLEAMIIVNGESGQWKKVAELSTKLIESYNGYASKELYQRAIYAWRECKEFGEIARLYSLQLGSGLKMDASELLDAMFIHWNLDNLKEADRFANGLLAIGDTSSLEKIAKLKSKIF